MKRATLLKAAILISGSSGVLTYGASFDCSSKGDKLGQEKYLLDEGGENSLNRKRRL